MNISDHPISICLFLNIAYHVKVSVLDAVLEEEQAHIKLQDLGVYVYLGSKLLEILTIGPNNNEAKVPLSTQISEDKITMVAKTLGADEIHVGSVSIPQYIVLNGGLNTYSQWITLFEHQDDDEYDGQMGVNDDEEPRLHFKFCIAQDVITTTKRVVTAHTTTVAGQKSKKTVTTTNTTQQ